MLTLYHQGSSVCAAKVRIVLHEKRLEWGSEYVDVLKGEQFEPAYLKLNPNAVVPTLVHDDKVAHTHGLFSLLWRHAKIDIETKWLRDLLAIFGRRNVHWLATGCHDADVVA